MVVSKRVANAKSEKYHGNILKRGKVEITKKAEKLGTGPIILGFFLFVIVGSALLQIIRTATSGGLGL